VLRTLIVFATLAGAAYADLAVVKAERNLEKRSELALDYANSVLEEAKKSYRDAPKDFSPQMEDVEKAVDLSYRSLQDTGKAARRNPKYFKRAELRIRALLKRLDNLEKEIAMDDRQVVAAATKHIGEVHDQLLLDIMSKK
jgi:hypothetical protein